MRDEQGGHARLIHAYADAVAGDARLRHFEDCVADAISIADADFVIHESFDCEVFSELAEIKISATEELLPVAVGVHLIDKDGAMLSAVTGEISLAISVNVEFADHPAAIDWRFPNGGADGRASPLHIARKPDVH